MREPQLDRFLDLVLVIAMALGVCYTSLVNKKFEQWKVWAPAFENLMLKQLAFELAEKLDELQKGGDFETYPWVCPCGRLNRKTAFNCAICRKHWSFGKKHDVTPKKQKKMPYHWEEPWEENWDDQTWEEETWDEWKEPSTPRRQASQSPRGRQTPRTDQSPRSRAKGTKGKSKGKSKGKQKGQDGKAQASHPFGKGSAAMPPWPTWDVTDAGISPFQSSSAAMTPELQEINSMQEAASHLRLAYKDPDARPAEVQAFLDRAEREANRSNIKSLHATTRALDKAQKALQDAVSARKEHRLLWTKHVSEGIQVWESQLESYRVHQANLSEQAAKARAEIAAARRNIQNLSDQAVTEGNVAIPQPIRAEAEDAITNSLGLAVDTPADAQGVQEISEDEGDKGDKPMKRPRSVEPEKATPAKAVSAAPSGPKS
eukprot:s4354_g5.t1